MNRKSCEGCIYHRRFSSEDHTRYCNYLLDTDEPRGDGDPAKCTKYIRDPKLPYAERVFDMTKKHHGRSPTAPEKVKEILKLRGEGMTQKEIAKATGAAQSTVCKVLKNNEPLTEATAEGSDERENISGNAAVNISASIVTENIPPVKSKGLSKAGIAAISAQIFKRQTELDELTKKLKRYEGAGVRLRDMIAEVDEEIATAEWDLECLCRDLENAGKEVTE